MKLIQAQNPDVKKIGLLYDVGQDSSTTAIQEAKDFLDEEGIEYVERTGTTTDEVQLAAEALIADGVDAVFTPTDNTIMTAELSIYEKFIEAGIPLTQELILLHSMEHLWDMVLTMRILDRKQLI